MMARVTDNGAVSDAFAVTNGVKQRCVLSPTLISLVFSAMLMNAYRDERTPGIRIAYRTDGHLLNPRRMHFKSPVSTKTVHELHELPQSFTILRVEGFRHFHEGRVQVGPHLLTLLLKLTGGEDHVRGPTMSTDAALAFRQ
ncbi:hypothetical protein SprV_1002808500 [Sparganum proliferum]